MDGAASGPEPDDIRRSVVALLERIEAGNEPEQALAEIRRDPALQLALAELYGLPVEAGRVAFSLDDCAFAARRTGVRSFVISAETRPAERWGATRPLALKLLYPSEFDGTDAVGLLADEFAAGRRWRPSEFLHHSPCAMVTTLAPGEPLDDWMAAREWWQAEARDDASVQRRLAATREIGMALCRELDSLHAKVPEGHGNLRLDGILVSGEAGNLQVTLIDLSADVRAAPPSASKRFSGAVLEDARRLGLAMLQVATPTPAEVGTHDADIQTDLLWLWGAAPGFARIIEDLVDGNPEQRLMMLRADEPGGTPWTRLAQMIDEEYERLRLFGPPSGVSNWSHVRHYLDVALQIGPRDDRADLPATDDLKWLNVAAIGLWVLILTGFLLLTYADIGLSAPDGTAKQFINDHARFTVGEFKANIPGRVMALTFGWVVLSFYLRILSSVSVRRLGLPWAELTLRAAPIVLNLPALYVIFYDPQSWAVAAALGVAFAVVVDWMMRLIDLRALGKMHDPLGYTRPARERAGTLRERHANWWRTLSAYLVVLIALALSLHWHKLRDEAFYAFALAGGVNLYAIYWNSIHKLGPTVRGCLEQSSFVLWKAEQVAPTRPFERSEIAGGTLTSIPIAAALALTTIAACASHEDVTLAVLGAIAAACLAAIALLYAIPGVQRGRDAPVGPRALAAVVAGTLVWSAASLGLVALGGWWRSVGLLVAAAAGVLAGHQAYRVLERPKSVSQKDPSREQLAAETAERAEDAFAFAADRVRDGSWSEGAAIEMGRRLIGGDANASFEERRQELEQAWNASPRVGRLAEALLGRPGMETPRIASLEDLDALRAGLRLEPYGFRLFLPSDRAGVCLVDGTALSPRSRRVLRAVGVSSAALMIVAIAGWAFYMVTDLDWVRSSARTLALSYALCAGYFYRALVGWITVTGLPGRRGTEIALRSVPFFLELPVLTAIFLWPEWWPVQASIGIAGTLLVNYLLWKLIADAADALEEHDEWADDDAEALRQTPFSSWWTTAAMYLICLGLFDVLLTGFGVLRDSAVYTLLLATGINLYIIVFSSLYRNGALVRAQVARAVVLLRHYAPEPQARLPVTLSAPAVMLLGHGLAAAAVAAVLPQVVASPDHWDLGAAIAFGVVALALAATLFLEAGETDPTAPRRRALSRLAAVLTCWCVAIAAAAIAHPLPVAATVALVFAACLVVAATLREDGPIAQRGAA